MYEYARDLVLVNEWCKILQDFPIQTHKVIEHTRSDIACIDKIVKSCLIIDIAIPGDQNIIVKKQKKIDKNLWNLMAEVVHVVFGTLSTVYHNLKFYLQKIDICIVTSCL